MDTLATYLREKMFREHISAREAGKAAGVAHTTIIRILEGRNVSLETLDKVAKYLGMSSGDFMDTGDLDAQISLLLQSEPALHDVFRQALEKVQSGEVSPETIREIVKYVSWRINYDDAYSRTKTSEGGGGVPGAG